MKKPTSMFIVAAIAATGLIVPSIAGTAFAHPHLVLTPDESDHEQMNANPVVVTLGHSNEPSYGAKPGIHDGKHNLELSIEDAATTLPLAGANLTIDRYYFTDLRAFDRASSPEDATEVDMGIQLRGVFGEPGVYSLGQIVKDGIYGYRVYGTVDYFGAAQLPIDSTVFCTTPAGNTSKFNSPGWEGSYGCVSDIDSLLFPENNVEVRRIDSANIDGQIRQTSLEYAENTENSTVQTVMPEMSQILMMAGPVAGVAAFFGIKKLRGSKDGQ